MHDRDRANAVASEKAVLVRVQLDDAPTSDDPLAELNGLVKTAGAEVVALIVQALGAPELGGLPGQTAVLALKQ